ncbi:hypothetical protein [Staphylococcus phage vB_SauM-V1SA22]|nr:hypothetical protein [Staphylococcus phage vB_SauM-V1SA22]
MNCYMFPYTMRLYHQPYRLPSVSFHLELHNSR